MIMRKLDELGLAEKTFLIFTSDNGGESRVTSNAPLRAGKSTLYEGGIREPLIIRRRGVVKPGSVCSTPTSNVDFYPTFLEFAGYRADARQHLDGVSILPLLKNPQAKLLRDTLYWHYPLEKPHFLGGRSSGAIRRGNWKLIEFFDNGVVELYNLAEDTGEKHTLAEKLPGKAAELQKRLAAWRKDVGVEVPDRMRKVK
jgi:arylsulfatase A-like enzyme